MKSFNGCDSRTSSKAGACAAAFAVALGFGAAAHADPLGTPAMSASLSANPSPAKIDAGPLGEVYVTGALTGVGMATSHKVADDRIDVSNAMVNIQTTEGPVQFFVQGGVYSFPALGFPYAKADDTVKALYGVVPLAYVKLTANEHFNVQAGKLPTLIGAEYGYTYQNLNINRGLLWFQENIVNDGVQANFSSGPVSLSVSLNDGFYSKHYSWLTGLATFALGGGNTLALAAGGNLDDTAKTSSATPLELNNSEMYNVIFTHAAGPWTITPYFQYTHVPNIPKLGIAKGSTTGAALLVNYRFNDGFSLAGRGEFINTKGAPNFQYSPGADAWSLTLTPTWQFKTFFLRGEGGYTHVSDFAPGSAYGASGNRKGQFRATLETGVLF
jgi:hypothetical protein